MSGLSQSQRRTLFATIREAAREQGEQPEVYRKRVMVEELGVEHLSQVTATTGFDTLMARICRDAGDDANAIKYARLRGGRDDPVAHGARLRPAHACRPSYHRLRLARSHQPAAPPPPRHAQNPPPPPCVTSSTQNAATSIPTPATTTFRVGFGASTMRGMSDHADPFIAPIITSVVLGVRPTVGIAPARPDAPSCDPVVQTIQAPCNPLAGGFLLPCKLHVKAS